MSLNLDELQQKADRVIYNADEITRKLGNLVYSTDPVQFQIYDANGNLVSRDVKSILSIQNDFENWKANFQGTLKDTPNSILVINVDAINGDDLADGINSPIKTLSRAKELIPSISKYSKIKIQLAAGVYTDDGLLFSHLTNYVDIVGLGTSPADVIINESGLIESYGASKFSLKNLKIISTSTTNSLLIRDNSFAYLENVEIEGNNASQVIKVEDGAFVRGNNISITGGDIGLMVVRSFARIDTISVSNSNTGIYATVGASIYRTNATYTNVTTTETADANSIIASDDSQLGTNTTSTTTNIVDFFGDGSGIALYQLDGDVNDTGGVYNGNSIGMLSDLKFSIDVAKPSFTQSLEIIGTRDRALLIPYNTNLQIKSMSLWVKKLSTQNSGNAYLFDSRYRGGNAYFIWNQDIFTQDIARYLVNGQSIPLNDSYKDQWIHLYIEFTNIQKGMIVGYSYDFNSYNYDFGGYVDQIRLFNRALTDSEVQQLYNEV